MKISNNYSNSDFSFNGNTRVVRNSVGKVLYRNNTSFFRLDLRWNKLVKKLDKDYAEFPKVNVYNFACSEGAEPLSLAMILIKKLGLKKASKFFPIKASDIDTRILENPKNGILKLTKGDLLLIKYYLGKSYKNFIELDGKFILDKELGVKVKKAKLKPIVRNNIIFENKNIVDDIENIEKENSIIFCRNFWPYLDKKEQRTLAQNIQKVLGNNSLCIIGSYDKHFSKVKSFLKYVNMKKYSGITNAYKN